MTTISLSTADTLLDLMPVLPPIRNSLGPAEMPVGVGTPAGDGGLGLRFLPRGLRDAIVRRVRQRELEAAFERLSETSAHLLADVGIAERPGTVLPATSMSWTRALPASGPSAAGTPSLVLRLGMLSRSRRRLGELDDRLLADVALDRAQARREARRRFWDAPAGWLR